MIVIVGDRPSRKNEDFEVAFVGTQSGKKLFSLLNKISMPPFIIINAYDINGNELPIATGTAYVALGNNAAKRLKSLNLKFFKLPHPSPKNRFWNKPDAEEKFLRMLNQVIESCS